MKKLLSTLFFGLILLFFIDNAFRIDGLKQEILIDNSVRFFLGFLISGIWCWSTLKWKFKTFIYVMLIFLASDVIFDYIEGISMLEIEMTLHDLYIFLWGAISGYFFVKYLQCKEIISV